MSESVPHINGALVIYRQINLALFRKERLNLNLGLIGLKCALHYCNHQQSQFYVRECLLKQVIQLTQQKLNNPTNDHIVDQSLKLCLRIFCDFSYNEVSLLTLFRIFDETVPYNQDEHKLVNNLGLFCDMQIIDKLNDLAWLGFDKTLSVLDILLDCAVRPLLRQKAATGGKLFLKRVMNQLMVLPENETSNSIPRLLYMTHLLLEIWTEFGKDLEEEEESIAHLTEFYDLWLQLCLQLIQCTTNTLKLLGWDLITCLLTKVKADRPVPDAYTVTGAGDESVNGVYRRESEDRYVLTCAPFESEQEYVLEALYYEGPVGQPDRKIWTLFSEIDGSTDQNYYAYTVSAEEPPPFPTCWTNNRLENRLPNYYCLPSAKRVKVSETDDLFLDEFVVAWCLKNRILSTYAEDESEEIIEKSTPLKEFLMEYDVSECQLIVNEENEVTDLVWNSQQRVELISDLNQQVEDKTSNNDKLKVKLQTANASIADLTNRLQTSQNSIADLTNTLQTATALVADVTNTLRTSQNSTNSAQSLSNMLQNKLNTLEGVTVEECDSLESQLIESLKTIKNKKATLTGNQNRLCVVCQTNEKSIAIVPCGHICVCLICSSHPMLRSCPLCRVPIYNTMRVFL